MIKTIFIYPAYPGLIVTLFTVVIFSCVPAQEKSGSSITIPFTLDHNRMMVDGEMRKSDGTWRKVLFWVDSGNPDFMISGELAKDLGLDLSGKKTGDNGYPLPLEIAPITEIRLGSQRLSFPGITTRVMFEPRWIFATIHIDGNIPSALLKHFHVVIDYPVKQISLERPGNTRVHGKKISASIDKKTGIIQMDGMIESDSISLALDIGASFSFISEGQLKKLAEAYPEWPAYTGAAGCANIWGWWPDEDRWTVVRIPELRFGEVSLKEVGIGGLPNFFSGGKSLGEWYSKKTAKPVDGILEPNAFKGCCIEIDYENNKVYITKTGNSDLHDMDVVGITIGLDPDAGYQVIGVVKKNGQAMVSGIEAGDLLLQIGNFKTSGETMGRVVDALRGKPGEMKILLLQRKDNKFEVNAKVERLL